MSIHDFEVHRSAMIAWLYFEEVSSKMAAKLDTTWLAQQINKQYPGGWAAFVRIQDTRFLEDSNEN